MKKIAIIGGGISGLTVLHYLKQRLGDAVDVMLYERELMVGGTVRSMSIAQGLFELGPNGFLDNQPSTLELINALGLSDQLIEAHQAAQRRFIQIKGKLHQIPSDPIRFIQTPLLSVKNKFRLVKGLFNKKVSTDQSIYDYMAKRFSPAVSERLVDPFISGVYAGDIKRLHMASAFPKMFSAKKRPVMRSLRQGMGQLIEALGQRYHAHIKTNSEVMSVADFKADIIILATPAYVTTKLVEEFNLELSYLLAKISYVPVAVAGLVFDKKTFKRLPDGFGYLIPSSEAKDILGVLIESNVFANRAGQDQVLLRVMMGGAHHPAIINDSEEQILAKAIKEIESSYGLNAAPLQSFVKLWPKAIPQYELNYPSTRSAIAKSLKATPQLQLCANYLDGVSFNDCINNAKSIAANIGI